MVFGTFVGGLADKCGRKKFATLYCLTYILSCLTKVSTTVSVNQMARASCGHDVTA
jgi:hypothetical protein